VAGSSTFQGSPSQAPARRPSQGAAPPAALIQCHDPDNGDRRWRRELEVSPNTSFTELRVVGHRVIYRDSAQIVALDVDDGDVAWRFDPSGRAVTALARDGERLVVSLNRDLLVWLDARDGAWRRGVKVPEHRLLGSHRGQALVALLRPGTSGALLAAVPLEGPGGREPAPPFPTQEPRWTRALSRVPQGLWPVGGRLVVRLDQSRWMLLDQGHGDQLHQEGPGEPLAAALGTAGSQTPFPDQGHQRLAALTWESLRGQRALPEVMGSLLEDQPGPLVFGQRTRQGVVLPLREVAALDPASQEVVWVSALPTDQPLRATVALPSADALLLMTGSHGLVLDRRSGALLAQRWLPAGREGWTDVASQGQGLYVVYGRDPQPRLEAWPLRK
jgi:hypothetical protein